MGVILEYAEARVNEVRGEVQKFLSKPLGYVMDKQVLRKAILLEFLDYARPTKNVEWEHTIERWRRGTKL